MTMTLTPTCEKFILHWGEMGTRWGVNRTVAQIHALLYLSPDPLNAEQIAETLSVARSNVSNSLRELQGWGIVKVVHVLGDRRDHYESMKDVWEMFRVIVDERKKREDAAKNVVQMRGKWKSGGVKRRPPWFPRGWHRVPRWPSTGRARSAHLPPPPAAPAWPGMGCHSPAMGGGHLRGLRLDDAGAVRGLCLSKGFL